MEKEIPEQQHKPERHVKDQDIRDRVCKMAVSVNGVVISDMKSFLARKKAEREQRSKNLVKNTGTSGDEMLTSQGVNLENKNKNDTDVRGGCDKKPKSDVTKNGGFDLKPGQIQLFCCKVTRFT